MVSRIVAFGAVAGGLAAAASDRTDRALAQIAEGCELTKDFGTLGFQFRQRVWHESSLLYLSVYEHSERGDKKIPANYHSCVAHPGKQYELTQGTAFARLRDAAGSVETELNLVYRAEVAELADARGSGPRTRKGGGVRVPSSAPSF